MRQEHNRSLASGWKPASIDQVVFWKRRAHRRGEPQEISVGAPDSFFKRQIWHSACAENFDRSPLQAEVRWFDIGKEFITRRDDSPVVFAQIAFAVFRN